MHIRIGEGWDIHALVPGRRLVLGGVEIPHEMGLYGHSDADVLLHAITDALLGAAGLGDIGQRFPDTDSRYDGADSAQLLRLVSLEIHDLGWTIVNLDCTVIAQAPKLLPYRQLMQDTLANILAIDKTQLNIKAKTAEKMGPVGLKHAIEARAVILLARQD